MRSYAVAVSLFTLLIMSATVTSGEVFPDVEIFRTWVQEMKTSPRGPFQQIRWFCNDGTVHPPRPYPCGDRGGGVQHGEWNARVNTLRENGFFVGNVLADIKPDLFFTLPSYEEILKQIIIEQFLILTDDGWIFRKARYYRGALQAENEESSGRALLLQFAGKPDWITSRFTVLREAVRFLPQAHRGVPVVQMRQLSRALAEKDAEFEPLRVKIHVKPDAGDVESVRRYTAASGRTDLSEEYNRLVAIMDQVYETKRVTAELVLLAQRTEDPLLKQSLPDHAARLSEESPLEVRFAAACQLLALLRRSLPGVNDPQVRLALLRASVELEETVFLTATHLSKGLENANRRTRISYLKDSVAALYGVGLLSERQLGALETTFDTLLRSPVLLSTYKRELDYASLAPEWTDRWFRFHFLEAVDRLALLEPLAGNYLHDRLRGSPLLFYADVLDGLIMDSNQLLGVRHELFGETILTGLRALNPGLARGPLRITRQKAEDRPFESDGIYVLPVTTEELPPVAGIVTAGEGNSLSHVQLLARNLGIPNVVINEKLLPRLASKDGIPVVLAVSPKGVVRMVEDGPRWDSVFDSENVPSRDGLIRPDLAKLNLSFQDIVSLKDVRARDSGRIVGPKAGNLGELKAHFPESVTRGLVIPFGKFREILDQPFEAEGISTYQWMLNQYAHIRELKGDPAEGERFYRRFLEKLRNWILQVDIGEDFREKLRARMEAVLGAEGTYGVFVRSDTNVEDLPGFTGAGLNRTVPNVVGFDPVLEAIKRVWASPFEERAYAWRQAHMEHPEHVYVSVLLLKSIPVDKSGVMITVDLDDGNAERLSVAVNEGVGGAVSGQGAEELRIRMDTGQVRLMAQAGEPMKRVLTSSGGVAGMPASGNERVLETEEIQRLIELARQLPERMPEFRNPDGRPLPADVEFGFLNSRLVLFQIRPFLSSERARRSRFLSGLDRLNEKSAHRFVELEARPLVEDE